jgi:hypothetical protein
VIETSNRLTKPVHVQDLFGMSSSTSGRHEDAEVEDNATKHATQGKKIYVEMIDTYEIIHLQ